MDLLVLGGTGFVGPAVVADALARGWRVTVFHRGRSPAPAGVEERLGDRTAADGLDALRQGTWDVVLDTWSGAPWVVADAAALLQDRCGHHVYVSSRSVYAWPPSAGADESAPVVDADPDDGDVEYPRAKRGGELAAERSFPNRATALRAGLILGPGENVDRLPWWLRRIERGGDVLAPGPPDLALQYVDARDLAAFALDLAAAGRGGAFDTVSPPGHTTTRELLTTCVEVTGSDARLRWAPPEVIEAHEVAGWTELPIWAPPGELHDALHRSDVSRAVAAGLRCRPVAETVADTWDWLRRTGGAPRRTDRPSVGVDPATERRVLDALGDADDETPGRAS